MTEFRHIIRLANTDIKGEKPLQHALRKIKGISFMTANAICVLSGINKDMKAGDLSDAQVKKLDEIIRNPSKAGMPTWLLNRRKEPETGEDKHLIMGELDFAKEMNIKMLKKMKSYKGLRHQWGLPVRGQRTKSNFRPNKGKGLGVKRKKGRSGRV